MKRLFLLVPLLLCLANTEAFGQRVSFQDAVESIEGRIEPAEARPGQTVTYKLTVKLRTHFYTYPTVQPDPIIAESRNEIVLPTEGDLIFVEPVSDPPNAKIKTTKIGAASGKSSYYPDEVTWEFKAVVSPLASPGEKKIALKKFRPLVCKADGETEFCLPPRTVPVVATIKVAGERMAVEDKYLATVEKELAARAAVPLPVPGKPKDPTVVVPEVIVPPSPSIARLQ